MIYLIEYCADTGNATVLVSGAAEYAGWQIEHLRSHPTNKCIEWPFAKADRGYGFFNRNKETIYVYRYAYEVFYDTKIKGVAMHECDNPSCFNPLHIKDGTLRQNSRDAHIRGRYLHSDRFKLSRTDIEDILTWLDEGVKQVDIAARKNITQSMVSHIKRGRSWSFLQEALSPKSKE